MSIQDMITAAETFAAELAEKAKTASGYILAWPDTGLGVELFTQGEGPETEYIDAKVCRIDRATIISVFPTPNITNGNGETAKTVSAAEMYRKVSAEQLAHAAELKSYL